MNKKTKTKRAAKNKPVDKKIINQISHDEVIALVIKEVNKLAKEIDELKKLKTTPQNLKKLRIANKEIERLTQKYKEAVAAKKTEEICRKAEIVKAAKATASSITDSRNRTTTAHPVSPEIFWKKKAEDEKFKAALADKIRAFIKIINDANESPKKSTTKPKMRFDNKRAFLLSYLKEDRSPNFESVWLYIKENAGKENFIFKGISNETATMTDGTLVEKSKYSRQFKSLLKKIKETKKHIKYI